MPRASEHFQPPGVFSTSLDNATLLAINNSYANKPPSSDPAAPLTDQPEHPSSSSTRGLLLPDHIIVDDDPSSNPDRREKAVSMEGVHILDDNTQSGATRYFVPEIEEDSFVANANLGKLCSNCRKPGHFQKECPHTFVRSFLRSAPRRLLIHLVSDVR
jgi:protein AIR1/2